MEEEYQESHGRRTLAIVLIIVLAVSGVAYLGFFWMPGIDEGGFQRGFASGYGAGKWDGNITGYNQGRQIGFGEGHQGGIEEGEYAGYTTGYGAGRLEGYQTGYADGYVEGGTQGYNVHNPLYTEAMSFVETNKVDEHPYSLNYSCFNYCADFEAAAYDRELRVGFVYIAMKGGAHSIVAFNTADRGLLLIEPQDDHITTVTIGKVYWDRTVYQSPGYDDTVTYIAVIW